MRMASGADGAEASSQGLEHVWLMIESLTEQLVVKAKLMESVSGKEKKETARTVVINVGLRLVGYVNDARERYPEIERFNELLGTVSCTSAAVEGKRTFEMQLEGQA